MVHQDEKVSSTLPAFMAGVEEAPSPESNWKVEDTEGLNFRSVVLVKATGRLSEQAVYLDRISEALSKVLAGFIAENPFGECVDRFVDLEDQVNAVETALKGIKSQISMSREVFFPARMDEERTKTHTSSETGTRMSRTARVFAAILSDQQEGAYKWLRDNDLGALIKETVNSSSLCAAAKEVMANGQELPEELFNVHLKDGVSITKAKAGAKK